MSELYGDWDKLFNALYNMQDMKGKLADAVVETAKTVEINIKSFIENQEIDLVPLTEEYLRRKVAQGYDPRILIKTNQYLESIAVTDIEISNRNITIFVGVIDGATSTGISLAELAYYIEYGTFRQPARLPFTKSWERMRADIQKEFIDRIKDAFEGCFR